MKKPTLFFAILLAVLSVVFVPTSDTTLARSTRERPSEAATYAAARQLEDFILKFRKLEIRSSRGYAPVERLVEGRESVANLAREFRSAVDPSRLCDTDWIDYFLLRSSFIELIERYDDVIEYGKKISALMPFEAVLYDIVEMLYLPDNEASHVKCAALKAVPAQIEDARKKIEACKDGRFVGEAFRRVDGLKKEFDKWSKATAATVPGFRGEYGAVCQEISKALAAILEDGKKRGRAEAPRPEPKPIGAEKFARHLVVDHHETESLEKLYAFGQRRWDEITAELVASAAKIDPSKTYLQIIEDMRAKHPAQGEVAPAYDAMMASLRRFFAAKKIITLPDDIFETVRTVRFVDADERVPFASYNRDTISGRMNVSVPRLDAKASDREAKLRAQNYYFMFTVVPHETVPGHHLQIRLAASLIRPRVEMYTTFFVEGWAFYCEELMEEQGFYEKEYQPQGWDLDPAKILLYQLKWRLHRAARLLIDIGWHTGRITQAEAEKMLVEKVGLHPNDARAEVNRYMWTPTQPMSYMIGKRDIMAIREGWQATKKSRFSLCNFHDTLLSYGSVPPTLVRAVMLGERAAVQKRLDKALAKYE